MKRNHFLRDLSGTIPALALGAALLAALPAFADVRLPHVIASDMVLQREMPIPIWGWADAGEEVVCELGQAKAKATADAEGKWQVRLPAMPAGGPYEMTIQGHNSLKLTGILVGEVWLCSGQSNMEFGIGMSENAKAAIAAADHPQIHLYLVPKTKANAPAADVDATWKACSPETVVQGGWSGFSAAAYFFGVEIQKALNVPVGLIDSCWGGTRIEPWTPPVGYEEVPALKQLAEQHKLNANDRASDLYNGMIHPLAPFAIRGALWYQGEANNGEGMLYSEKMKGLIAGWRKVWNEGDFPFYFVQIAPFNYGPNNGAKLPALWTAQLATLAVPNTGMAVTTDIATLGNIHPPKKAEVGHRLALWALAKTYGKSDLVYSGPLYKSMKVEGGKIAVSFDDTGSGLATRDGKDVTNFEIAGADGNFVPAQAKIEGNQVIVSADGVAAPAQVRFGWDQLAQPNLINKEQLPASPFSTELLPH